MLGTFVFAIFLNAKAIPAAAGPANLAHQHLRDRELPKGGAPDWILTGKAPDSRAFATGPVAHGIKWTLDRQDCKYQSDEYCN